MIQKWDFAPFTKANHHLANAKHRLQLQKWSLGNSSSQRENGKAASAKAGKPFFIYLVLINRKHDLWNTNSWRNLMNSFCIKQHNHALIEERVTAGAPPQDQGLQSCNATHRQFKPVLGWEALEENLVVTESTSNSFCFLIHPYSNTHMPRQRRLELLHLGWHLKIKVVLLMVIKNPTAFFRNKWVLASVSLPNISTAVIFLAASVKR